MVPAQVPAATARMVAIGRNLVAEVVFVVRSQVAHAEQNDDHYQGDHGRQADQHGLRHRTIHRGVWP